MSPAVATICSMRRVTSPAAASMATARRCAAKTKKPPVTPAAMRTAATITRFVCFCIRRQDSRRRSELYVSLNEDPIVLRSRGGRVVVHLFVGDDQTNAIARPYPPVRAARDHATLRIVRERLVRIERIDSGDPRPPGRPLTEFDEARRAAPIDIARRQHVRVLLRFQPLQRRREMRMLEAPHHDAEIT